MQSPLSRRAVLGGTLAIAGTSAFCTLPAASSITRAPGEELFVGFIKDRWATKSPRAWHTMVRNDGSDERLFHRLADEGREGGCMAHGARVWAVWPPHNEDGQRIGPPRILHLEPADSTVSIAARLAADSKACANGEWVYARVLMRCSTGRSRILIRCQGLAADDSRWLYRPTPVGALATATPKDQLLIKFGKTWDGWEVFEARRVDFV